MKSIMSCPSQYLPIGLSKKLSPLGSGVGPKDVDRPPVSELESPKLNTTGKSHAGNAVDDPSSSRAASIKAARES